MRIGIISDLHWKISKGGNSFLKHVEAAVEYFYDLCIEYKVDRVLILGDTFHVKQSIDTYCLNRCLFSMRKLFAAFECDNLVGNHETLNRNNNTINLLNIFATESNVITDYKFVDIARDLRFHFMPYFNDEVLRESKLSLIQSKPSANNIMFGHFSFQDFAVTEGHENVFSSMHADEVLSKGIDFIYSGHFHSYCDKDSVCYVSSPIESHFNEGGEHGFVFFDTNDLSKREFFPNIFSPRFIETTLTKKNYQEVINIKDSYLSILLKNDLNPIAKESLKRKLLAKNYFVKINTIEADSSTGDGISTVDGWDDYIFMTPEDMVVDYVHKNQVSDKDFTADDLIEEILYK